MKEKFIMLNASKIRRRFRVIIFLILFTSGMVAHIDIWAQGSYIWNATDRLQPWASEINPAIISFQKARVSLGLKVFHLGFLPDNSFGLKESHINASFPFYLPDELGIGCDLRYFSAGAYSEIIGSMMLSREVFDRFSLGIKIGLMRYGFDRGNFTLIDANDPLIGSNLWKTKLNLGLGAFWNPGYWTIGVGIDHANQPDMGFQTQTLLPLEISGAISYRIGRLMPTFLIQKDGMGFRYGLAFSIMRTRLGLLSVSYESNMPFKMEFQLHLSNAGRMHYALDLPHESMHTVSMGSHELSYTYIFDRGPDIAQPDILLSTKSMIITEETLVRSMPPGLSPIAVKNMGEVALEYLCPESKLQNLLIVKTGALNKFETKLIRKQRYTQLAKEIKQILRQHPDLKLILRTDARTRKDARSLKHYLLKKGIVGSKNISVARLNSSGEAKLLGFQTGQENTSHRKPTFAPQKLVIGFMVPGKTRHVQDWELIIMNTQKDIVKIFRGKDKLPDQLEWYWRNDLGELVSPGRYKCILSLRAMSGKKKTSVSQQFKITHVKRTTTLCFRQEPQMFVNKIKSRKSELTLKTGEKR